MSATEQPAQEIARARAAAAARAQRHFACALAGVLLLTHAWALFAFGATFWIDSSVFAAFAAGLGSAEKFSALYDLTGTFQYSHIGIGLPALWAALSQLPVDLRWPALALLQHGLAIAATATVFLTAHRLWPSWWHLAGAALLSVHPFYQSLHNALLTESITSSLLLFGIALALRLLFLATPARRDFFLLLACMFALIQFRSYVGAMLAAMAALALWKRRAELRWKPLAAGLAAAFLAGAMLLPAARWAITGRWFSPSLGTNALLYATWMNPAPSPALHDRLRALGWLREEQIVAMLAGEFDYPQAREIAAGWRGAGATDDEIRRRLRALTGTIESDRPGLRAMKLRCGLASCGWVALGFAGDSPEATYHGRSLAENRRHQLAHVRWLSWVEHPSYRSFGEGFFLHLRTGIAGDAEAQRALWAALRKHISTRPAWPRDPLRLANLPPDAWAALGLLAIGICLWRMPAVGFILALPFVVNFAVTALSSLAGPRYAHPLLPISLLAASIAAALLMQRPRRSAPPAAA